MYSLRYVPFEAEADTQLDNAVEMIERDAETVEIVKLKGEDTPIITNILEKDKADCYDGITRDFEEVILAFEVFFRLKVISNATELI